MTKNKLNKNLIILLTFLCLLNIKAQEDSLYTSINTEGYEQINYKVLF